MLSQTYSLLELGKISRAESVGLGNDGNQVNASTQSLHHLNVERLEGVASRADEVETGVDTEIDLVLTTRLLLLKHVGLVLVVEELDNGHPRVTVVDIVAKSGGIDDGQSDCIENWESIIAVTQTIMCGVRQSYP
jgi:hypothetical protein